MMPVAAAKLASFVLVALLNVAIRTPVVDQAGVLTNSEREAIELRVRALRQHTGVQLAVLTILSTEGEPIADFSHRTAVTWGGGRKGYDDGLLLTIAVTDRRSRLEVGYGLEAKLPDAVVRRLLENARDELQHRHYGAAITKILDHLDLLVAARPGGASSGFASTDSEVAAASAVTDPTPTSAALVEPPPRTISSSQPQPLSPHGLLVLLALVPLFGVVLGYALGAWRCSECAPAVDVFAYLTLGAAAFIALLFGVDNPHGYYLSVALFAIGWASMSARTSGLTLFGHLVAVLLCVIPAAIILFWPVTFRSAIGNSELNWQNYLLLAELVGAATLFLIAKIITRYHSHTFLWERSRARGTGRRFKTHGPYDDSGTWWVRRDSSDGGGGGGGGRGGGDWGGGGGDFGGGGADMSF